MCNVLCGGDPNDFAKLEASYLLQSLLLLLFVNSIFVSRDLWVLLYLNWYRNSSDAHIETQRPGFFAIVLRVFLKFAYYLLPIVCLYATSCRLPCILIKVLFILRPSRVQSSLLTLDKNSAIHHIKTNSVNGSQISKCVTREHKHHRVGLNALCRVPQLMKYAFFLTVRKYENILLKTINIQTFLN